MYPVATCWAGRQTGQMPPSKILRLCANPHRNTDGINNGMIMSTNAHPLSTRRHAGGRIIRFRHDSGFAGGGRTLDGNGLTSPGHPHSPNTLLPMWPVCALLCFCLAVSAAQADPPVSPATGGGVSARSLPPEKLDAIRAIGRNLLQAKKNAQDNPADAESLAQLRTVVDKLIAVENLSSNSVSISVEGTASTAQTAESASLAQERAATRAAALEMVGQLRRHTGAVSQQAQSAAVVSGSSSAGFPVGEQRGRLFERLADKLEGALAADNAGRMAQLQALRDQIQTTHSGVIETPLTHGTPTIQAMPWNPAPPASAQKQAPDKDRRATSPKH